MNEQNQISAKQLGIYIIGAQVGVGIIFVPQKLAQNSGHDGWISLIFGGIISICAAILIMLLLQRYRDQSIFQINRLLFGKIAAVAINFLLLLYLFYLAFMGLRAFAEYILLIQADQLSLLAVSILIIAPTVYLTAKGLAAICNFSYYLVFFLGMVVVLAGLVYPLHWNFLLPVGASGLPPLIKDIPICSNSYLGFELVVFLYPMVKDKRRALFWVVTANLISMFFFVLVFVLEAGLFGEEMLKKTIAPLFQLPQFIRFGIKERMDMLFSLLWFPFLESTLRAYFYACYSGSVNLFGIKKIKIFLAIFTIVFILINLIPKNLNQFFKLADLINYSGTGVISFLLVCYGLSFFLERLEKT
ncbi:MAG: GerAB/ArcD/ProY family transporter [Bacillota bacterium]|jgi:spore germination protein (amino acid permease)